LHYLLVDLLETSGASCSTSAEQSSESAKTASAYRLICHHSTSSAASSTATEARQWNESTTVSVCCRRWTKHSTTATSAASSASTETQGIATSNPEWLISWWRISRRILFVFQHLADL
jgi:hypothetical protein